LLDERLLRVRFDLLFLVGVRVVAEDLGVFLMGGHRIEIRRQLHVESYQRSLPLLRKHLYAPLQLLNDELADDQAQVTVSLACLTSEDSNKPEEFGLFDLRETMASIQDRHDESPTVPSLIVAEFGSNLDLAVSRGLQGIGDQVHEHLLQPLQVRFHQEV